MPNQNSGPKTYGPSSGKTPPAGAILRTQMFPDVSVNSMVGAPTPGVGPNGAECQGSNPSTPGVTVNPISMPVDNNRVPGRSGDAGPM